MTSLEAKVTNGVVTEYHFNFDSQDGAPLHKFYNSTANKWGRDFLLHPEGFVGQCVMKAVQNDIIPNDPILGHELAMDFGTLYSYAYNLRKGGQELTIEELEKESERIYLETGMDRERFNHVAKAALTGGIFKSQLQINKVLAQHKRVYGNLLTREK